MTGNNHQSPLNSRDPLAVEDAGDIAHDERKKSLSLYRVASRIRHGLAQSRGHWGVLALGQALSFLLACSGAAQATLHLDCSLSAPTFATGLMYFFLLLLAIPWCYQRLQCGVTSSDSLQDAVVFQVGEEQDGIVRSPTTPNSTTRYLFLGRIPLHTPAWAYFLFALLDVEANYLTVLAFRFTTLTSVTLFDALAIPSAMVFSKFCLKRRYVPVHLIGAIICMTGIVVNVLTDYESDEKAKQHDDDEVDFEEKEYPHKLLGDFLAILGGLIYGANDVLQEYMVKGDGGPLEFLSMLGFFGVCISTVQVLVLERNDVAQFFGESLVRGGGDDNDENTCDITTGILLLMGYVVSLSLGYIGGAFFLVISEAALLNLSLLTGDLWSVTFSVVAERIVPSWLFFVALVLIVSGVLLYETGPSPIVAEETDEQRNTSSSIPSRDSNVDLGQDAWRYSDATANDEIELVNGIS